MKFVLVIAWFGVELRINFPRKILKSFVIAFKTFSATPCGTTGRFFFHTDKVYVKGTQGMT